VRFLLDENFGQQTAAELQGLGHNVAVPATLNVRRRPDYRVLEAAIDDQRILVTHNIKDFVLLTCGLRIFAERWRVSPGTVMYPGVLGIAQFTADWTVYAALIDERTRQSSIANEVHIYHPLRGWVNENCRKHRSRRRSMLVETLSTLRAPAVRIGAAIGLPGRKAPPRLCRAGSANAP